MTLPVFPSDLDLARWHGATPQQAFAAANAGAAIFMRQRATGLVLLAVSPGRVVLTIAGAIASEHIVGVLRDADIAARLGSDTFRALIDISDFSGTIDWRDIQEIGAVMPKGDSRTNRNAYVVRNPLWLAVAKITAAFFRQTECAAFPSAAEARAWLGWE